MLCLIARLKRAVKLRIPCEQDVLHLDKAAA
eukprot:COSAG06_NODE_28633_length_570_cov_23.000000_1_plen_30_part_10